MPVGTLSSALRTLHGLSVRVPTAVADVSVKDTSVCSKPVGFRFRTVVDLPTLKPQSGQAPQISLIGLLDRFLVKQPASQAYVTEVRWGGPRRRGVFHPSEICKEDVCSRALAYELYTAPKDEPGFSARFHRIFQNGHFMHARYQLLLRLAIEDSGGRFWSEVKWPDTVDRISGSCDGVFDLCGWRYALELKSMKKSNFMELGAQPWPDHRKQLNTYMYKKGIKQGIVLVECKDTQDVREYFIRYDSSLTDSVHELTDGVLAYVNRFDLPPQITVADGCKGKDCAFYRVCKGDEKDWRPA